MRICDYCRTNVLATTETWGTHKKSLEDLRDAASQRCLFCSQLLENLGDETSWFSRGDWPMYQWHKRTLGGTRESTVPTVITFSGVTPRLPRQTGTQEERAKLAQKVLRAGHVSKQRRFYSYLREDLDDAPSENDIASSTRIEDSGPQIFRWLKECSENHTGCTRSHSDPDFKAPTRLIYVGGADEDVVNVMEPADELFPEPYTTLSHCWGPAGVSPKLTRENHDQFCKEIRVETLPPNFVQAIQLTRFLQVKHIWIDALCIKQGSEAEGGDFHHEAHRMHHVYRNSYCNLAAADSMNPMGGFYRERDKTKVIAAVYEVADDIGGVRQMCVVSEDLWNAQLLSSPLYTRGWVFQERMLSPRMLHFARDQIFWDCGTTSACESIPRGLPQPLDGIAGPDRHWRKRLQATPLQQGEIYTGDTDDSLEDFWRQALRNFSSCNLTNVKKDKLTAIWGIAVILRSALGEGYGAGLWETNFVAQLGWKVVKPMVHTLPWGEIVDERSERLSHYPTWSWASVEGEVEAVSRLDPWDHDHSAQDHDGGPLCFQLKPEEDCPDHPELETNAIAVQAHIGSGMLQWGETAGRWSLAVPDEDGGSINLIGLNMFPDDDLDEKLNNRLDCNFVVLVRREEGGRSSGIWSGLGITLRNTTKDRHFARTGTFQFHSMRSRYWKRLEASYKRYDRLPQDWDRERGLKFWLE